MEYQQPFSPSLGLIECQAFIGIIVKDNRIIAVEKGFSPHGQTDQLIDLSDRTVLSGLMDMHVHIPDQSSKDNVFQRFNVHTMKHVTCMIKEGKIY